MRDRSSRRADVPGSFKGAPQCRGKNGNCKKPASNWLHMVIKIMERETKVRVAFCDECFEGAKDEQGARFAGARFVDAQ